MKEKWRIKAGKLIGMRFGRLVAIEVVGKRPQRDHVMIKCKCDCGNLKITRTSCLIRGETESCGCYAKELSGKRTRTHGMSRTNIGLQPKLYRTWINIRERCHNEKHQSYGVYGALGVSVCNEWRNNFVSFYNWAINNGCKKGLSIERINVYGNYTPENCKWIPMKQQASNRRNTLWLIHNGEKRQLRAFAKEYGIPYATARERYWKNWSSEEILSNRNHNKKT